jgi:hypothetical protein
MSAGDVLSTTATALRSEHIGNVSAPDVSICHIVQTLVAFLAEGVHALDISHFVVLDPVVSQVKLSLVGGSVFAHAIVPNNPRHESAVLTEQAERLEMGLSQVAGPGRGGYLISRHVTLDGNIVNGREVVSDVLFHKYISSRPSTHICLINKKL